MKSIKEKTVAEVWQEIETALNANPQPFQDMNVVYQYEITGEDGGNYQLHLADGKATVLQGAEKEADCTLKLSDKNFKDMITGKLKGTTAFMMGKLKINGNMGLALKLEGILQQYDFQ